MKTRDIIELGGILIVIIGAGCVVAAASYVSVALALLAAGVFLVFGGGLAVVAANQQPEKPVRQP